MTWAAREGSELDEALNVLCLGGASEVARARTWDGLAIFGPLHLCRFDLAIIILYEYYHHSLLFLLVLLLILSFLKQMPPICYGCVD